MFKKKEKTEKAPKNKKVRTMKVGYPGGRQLC